MTGKTKGWVSLVGAGPGDPELLTLKAWRRLQQAEVVVYDRLVSKEILALIPAGTARIFAGKSCKQHYMTQGEINRLLLKLAQQGKGVVRLKGGDPFIFGRGGEEVALLAQYGISFEIIPGITAATGCSAYAGIPLTHRGLASSVRFLTGHQMAAPEEGEAPPASGDTAAVPLNWASLADADTTLVVYMGLAKLGYLTGQLIAHGLEASTPAAAVQNGTRKNQRQVLATLATLEQKVREAAMDSPMTVIIGRVAALAESLQWFQPGEEEEDRVAFRVQG